MLLGEFLEIIGTIPSKSTKRISLLNESHQQIKKLVRNFEFSV